MTYAEKKRISADDRLKRDTSETFVLRVRAMGV